jgi:hypothetical protein
MGRLGVVVSWFATGRENLTHGVVVAQLRGIATARRHVRPPGGDELRAQGQFHVSCQFLAAGVRVKSKPPTTHQKHRGADLRRILTAKKIGSRRTAH